MVEVDANKSFVPTKIPSLTTTSNITTLDRIQDYLNTETHGFITMAVCFTGFAMNILTMIILTRKAMRNPTNFLLGCICIADMMTIFVYSPHILVSVWYPEVEKYSPSFAYYKIVSIFFPLIYTLILWRRFSLTFSFKFYSGTWLSYLMDLLSLMLVGAVEARINVRSSYYQWRSTVTCDL